MATLATLVKRSLEAHEKIIESGIRSFFDVGTSLLAIRDERLYQKQHDTFEDYCAKRWGLSRPRAYQYIESAVAVSDLSTIVDKKIEQSSGKLTIPAPTNEAQARAVAEAAPDANTRRHIWEVVARNAPKDKDGNPKITAALVKKVAAKVTGNGEAPANSEPNGQPREPGEDKTEPAHQDQHDHFKVAVPESLREVFAEVEEFNRLRRICADLKSGAKNICETKAGGWLKGQLQELEEHSDQIKRLLRFSAPHTECAKCKRKPEKKCPACKGTGWVTEAMMNSSFSDAEKKWLESR